MSPAAVIDQPGVYPALDFADYLATDAASSSRLRNIGRSPAYCRHMIDNPKDATPAMTIGSLVHALLLEPDAVAERYAVAGQCEATTGKGDACGNGGSLYIDGSWYCRVRGHAPDSEHESTHTILAEGDWDKAHAMHAAARAHPFLSTLSDVSTEVTALWSDVTEDGIPCDAKARADILATREGKRLLVDVKVCREAAQDTYPRKCVSVWHPQQLAWYARGLSAVGEPVHERWVLAIHSEPPHEVTAYRMTPELCHWSDDAVESRFRLYAGCVQSGVWPYGHDEVDVPVPDWALSDEIKTEDDE